MHNTNSICPMINFTVIKENKLLNMNIQFSKIAKDNNVHIYAKHFKLFNSQCMFIVLNERAFKGYS
jgi:hypothetical protein